MSREPSFTFSSRWNHVFCLAALSSGSSSPHSCFLLYMSHFPVSIFHRISGGVLVASSATPQQQKTTAENRRRERKTTEGEKGKPHLPHALVPHMALSTFHFPASTFQFPFHFPLSSLRVRGVFAQSVGATIETTTAQEITQETRAHQSLTRPATLQARWTDTFHLPLSGGGGTAINPHSHFLLLPHFHRSESYMLFIFILFFFQEF